MTEEIKLNVPSEIVMSLPDENFVKLEIEGAIQETPQIEIIKMNKEGFWYKGEKVEDIHNVYERFNEWLTEARKFQGFNHV